MYPYTHLIGGKCPDCDQIPVRGECGTCPAPTCSCIGRSFNNEKWRIKNRHWDGDKAYVLTMKRDLQDVEAVV